MAGFDHGAHRYPVSRDKASVDGRAPAWFQRTAARYRGTTAPPHPKTDIPFNLLNTSGSPSACTTPSRWVARVNAT